MSKGMAHLAEELGIDRDQLVRWVNDGHLHPIAKGRGIPQHWPAAEVPIARLLVRLTTAGMFSSPAAALARTAVAFGLDTVELGPGLTLKIDPVE
jgi:hypothetical protein